jgi:hypothetical protein
LIDCKQSGLEKSKWIEYDKGLAVRMKERLGKYVWPSPGQDGSTGSNIGTAPIRANYIGPIEVKEAFGRGRGLVPTRDVRAGELLLVEKAIYAAGTVYSDGLGITLSDVDRHGETSRHTDVDTAAAGVQAIIADPSCLLAFNALDPLPSRSSPFATEGERIGAIRSPIGPVNVDEHLRKCTINGFGQIQEGSRNFRLYGMASMLNHSCLANCAYKENGDVSDIFLTDPIRSC